MNHTVISQDLKQQQQQIAVPGPHTLSVTLHSMSAGRDSTMYDAQSD